MASTRYAIVPPPCRLWKREKRTALLARIRVTVSDAPGRHEEMTMDDALVGCRLAIKGQLSTDLSGDRQATACHDID